MAEKINIVFMGTPEFAVPTLQKLIDDSIYDVKGVYTQPDKPVGRKQILTPPPVKVLASLHGIPVFQPPKIRKNQEVLEHLSSLNLDYIVVVAYGKILPQTILDIPKKGCINVHGSLLEKYRGAAPIQWAIARGETVTGITTMLMDAGMDTGDMLLKASINIEQTDTTETLIKNLAPIGADLLIKTLNGLENKSVTPIKQDDTKATMAPVINKADGQIDWNRSATDILNLLRAFNPWPTTYTYFEGVSLKISQASLIEEKPDRKYKSGQIVEINKKGVVISTGDGLLLVTKVHLSGSKEMNATDFARGHRLETGFIFEDTMLC
jgi:methionyl-tRNA formyltransferase